VQCVNIVVGLSVDKEKLNNIIEKYTNCKEKGWDSLKILEVDYEDMDDVLNEGIKLGRMSVYNMLLYDLKKLLEE